MEEQDEEADDVVEDDQMVCSSEYPDTFVIQKIIEHDQK